MPRSIKGRSSVKEQAIKNLKTSYTIEALEVWRLQLAELYQVSKHPSVLASMRLLLAARNQKRSYVDATTTD